MFDDVWYIANDVYDVSPYTYGSLSTHLLYLLALLCRACFYLLCGCHYRSRLMRSICQLMRSGCCVVVITGVVWWEVSACWWALVVVWLSLQESSDEKYLPADEIWLYDADCSTWSVLICHSLRCQCPLCHRLTCCQILTDYLTSVMGLRWYFVELTIGKIKSYR